MATEFADDDVPSASDLNSIGRGVVEVYDTITERDAATPDVEAGQLVWIRSTGALDVYTNDGWVEIAQVTERLDIIRKQLAAPAHADPWRSQVATLETVYRARAAGLDGISGAKSRAPRPEQGGALFWSLEGQDVVDWSGDDAAGKIDDAREIMHYPTSAPNLDSIDTIAQVVNLNGVTYQADGDWLSIVMVGVCSWRVHARMTAQIIVVGAGGYGGAGGAVHLAGGVERSPVGGGGGGGGGVASIVQHLEPGEIITTRAGGRISSRTTDEATRTTPAKLGDEYGGDHVKRDGVSLDLGGGPSGVWLDGRLLIRAAGGSRGGTHIDAAEGSEPRPDAYLLAGGSQGGAAGLSGFVTPFPAPSQLIAGAANRGGSGGFRSSSTQTRVMASGGGGGGAASIGSSGQAFAYSNALGIVAHGGGGGAGIDLAWSGVPVLGVGGRGGWCAGYPAGLTIVHETGSNYGCGGEGGTYYIDTGLAGGDGGTHLASSHLPGLGVVIVRYRVDGGTFEETEL